MANSKALERFHRGTVIPAHPLALTAEGKLDERRQRALTRYYLDAGAGGVAVAVHTTQFAIRDRGLLEPVLTLAREEARSREDVIAVAGVCGVTQQAVREATLARDLGYDAALLSMAAVGDNQIEHVQIVAEIIPVVGFYLQPAVGGRVLPYDFWRKFAEIRNVIGIKMAPFNRYQTIDVIRAIAESGRDDITLYTGNDDNIVVDLLTPHRFGNKTVRIKGGLLGHWAVWTRRAVELLAQLQTAEPTEELLRLAIEVTDSNAAFFDAANKFHGCIPGIHEVLRRQGLLDNLRTLDPAETLGPGQLEEIDRVYRTYPHLNDDTFVAENLDRWLQ
jgi:dihydrodipicolinate synthase/N-acetylneuraminate lyase